MYFTVNHRLRLIVCVSLFFLICAPFIGSTMQWSFGELLFSDDVAGDIFWRVRLPRVFLGFLTGACLGGSGVVFQALFRNPLASPYTLGVASGASFGAVLAIKLGAGALILGFSDIIVGGMSGACLATLLVYFLYSRSELLSGTTMLLAGVVMSFFFSSLMLFCQYMSNINESFVIVRWLMGGLETIDYGSVLSLIPFVAAGLGLAWSFARDLDSLSTGDELAYSRGVDVASLRVKLFFITSLMIGAVVSFAGPIGFVGIIVPHFVRLFLGPRHRLLIPAAAVASGGFLVFCDCIARVVLAPAEIPVGIVTALLGGPFFLWILLSKKPGEFGFA